MMLKLLRQSFLPFLMFTAFVACDPCDDCDSSLLEPTISFIFINQDTISQINERLDTINFNDSSLTSNIDSLIELQDSLDIIIDSIANGGTLSTEKNSIETLIDQRRADSLLFETKSLGADTIATQLNEAKAIISSGLIQVSRIAITGTSFVEIPEDSSITWQVPLSYTEAFDEYQFTISDFTERIQVSYDTYQEVDDQRNVRIRAENIRVLENEFIEIDSVQSNCEENCLDGEAIFTFYF